MEIRLYICRVNKKKMENIFEKLGEILKPNVIKSLPTDTEIETWATYKCGGCSQESNDERAGLICGAKWMRRQILKAQEMENKSLSNETPRP